MLYKIISIALKNVLINFLDPRGRPQSPPVVITIFTQVVSPSVLLSVPILQNQAKITDCGLAEWIIDDSCLVADFIFDDVDFNSPIFDFVTKGYEF